MELGFGYLIFCLNNKNTLLSFINMEKVFHAASKRGFANHSWLKAAHSFSFGNYYDNEKIHFGKLRVLNDDIIAPGRGFDVHPHQDMEIITIPLSGSLRHGDNMGNEEIITSSEVQVMSAGSGIWHSEFNASETEEINLFQIWIFTDKKGHKPRYDQKVFNEEDRRNKWQILVSPNGESGSLWIHQEAYISIINAGDLQDTTYVLNKEDNGVYFMLIEGNAEIDSNQLDKRDALGCWDIDSDLKISFSQNTKLLAIEVPML
ncbi:pirin family protein [Draconibacterium sp.]|nr:pirin family protein [Draconibacterium sp.]